MENNEKKGRRPRISAPRPVNSDNQYDQPRSEGYQQRPYQPRPYQPRPWQPRQQQNFNNAPDGEQPQRRPYNPDYRQHEGGYNPNYRRDNRQGGYNPNYHRDNDGQPRDGQPERPHRPYNPNYRPSRPGQGYRDNRQPGGYNPNYRQGGPRPQQPRPGKSFTPRPKPVSYEQSIVDPEEELRLNKYMSKAGICSRREADEMIEKGLITVNGQVATTLGTKIKYGDIVEYDGKVVTPEKKCYILLNKPKDCMTTCDDPQGRKTVMDLVKGAAQERIYPVGRLDRMTTGVLLLTNDGELASRLTHPQYIKKKIYHVWTDKDISEDDMQAIADGIELEDGPVHADAISYATETDRNQAGIEIHSGKNRVIRRIFEHLGYHVTKLDRVYFAGLTKKNLPRGRWRYLTQEEVNALHTGRFE